MRLEAIPMKRLKECWILLMSNTRPLSYCLHLLEWRDALVRLELKDMEYLNDYNIYKIKIYKKSKYEQICFTTPEAAEAIKLFLKDSMKGGGSAKYFHNVDRKSISMTLGNLAEEPE